MDLLTFPVVADVGFADVKIKEGAAIFTLVFVEALGRDVAALDYLHITKFPLVCFDEITFAAEVGLFLGDDALNDNPHTSQPPLLNNDKNPTGFLYHRRRLGLSGVLLEDYTNK